MSKAKQPGTLKKTPRPLSDAEQDNLSLKVEVAHLLGLWDKVQKDGWGSLTAAESGRIGGYMTRVRQLRESESKPS